MLSKPLLYDFLPCRSRCFLNSTNSLQQLYSLKHNGSQSWLPTKRGKHPRLSERTWITHGSGMRRPTPKYNESGHPLFIDPGFRSYTRYGMGIDSKMGKGTMGPMAFDRRGAHIIVCRQSGSPKDLMAQRSIYVNPLGPGKASSDWHPKGRQSRSKRFGQLRSTNKR